MAFNFGKLKQKIDKASDKFNPFDRDFQRNAKNTVNNKVVQPGLRFAKINVQNANNYFKPTTNVRARDVIRELPRSISNAQRYVNKAIGGENTAQENLRRLGVAVNELPKFAKQVGLGTVQGVDTFAKGGQRTLQGITNPAMKALNLRTPQTRSIQDTRQFQNQVNQPTKYSAARSGAKMGAEMFPYIVTGNVASSSPLVTKMLGKVAGKGIGNAAARVGIKGLANLAPDLALGQSIMYDPENGSRLEQAAFDTAFAFGQPLVSDVFSSAKNALKGTKIPMGFSVEDVSKKAINEAKSLITTKAQTQGLQLPKPKVGQVDTLPTTASPANLKTQIETGRLSLPDYTTNTQLLPEGRPANVSEARKIFKKTGEAVDFVNTKKPNTKVVVSGPAGSKVTAERFVQSTGKKLEAKDIVDQLDLTTAKSQNAATEGMTDMFRNTERAFGKNNPVIENIIRPLDRSKGDFARDVTRIADDLKKNVVDDLNIRKGSKESAAVQMFGEGKTTYDELLTKFGKETADRIVKADGWFRQQYDTMLDEVNAVRKQIYPNNPDKIIPRRDDYYRHFQELSDASGIKNLFDNPANIPSALAGKSENLLPKSKWLSFAQKRTGDKTTYDAVGGFLDYANAQSYAKNIDPHIEKMRNFVDELGNRDVDGRLQSYVNTMRGEVDRLAGKTSKLDRSVEGVFGRKGLSVINWMNRRVKSNAILGNVSSAISQIFNLPNGLADAGYINSAVGAKNMMKNILSDADPYAKSNFITERFLDKTKSQFNQKLLEQPKKFAVWVMTAGDELGTKLIWNAEYEKFAKQGLPESKVIQLADEMTRKMVGGRGIGEVPLTLDSKTTQLITPFMVEVNNAWKVQKEFLDEGRFDKLIKLYLAGFIMNRAAEKIRGSDVIFDPIQASIEAVEAYKEEDNKVVGAIRAGGRMAGEVISNVPGGQYIASGIVPETGYKIPGTDENITRKELFGKGDPTRFGANPLFLGGLSDPAYKLLPSWGGQQIKRTIEGGKSLIKGYAEDAKKNIQFPVEQNIQNAVRSVLFGKYATTEGQDYTKNENRALSEKESKLYKAGATGVYNIAQLNRKVEDEKTAFKNGTKSSPQQIAPNIIQTSDGRYAIKKSDGGVATYDSLEESQEALLKSNTKDAKYQAATADFTDTQKTLMDLSESEQIAILQSNPELATDIAVVMKTKAILDATPKLGKLKLKKSKKGKKARIAKKYTPKTPKIKIGSSSLKSVKLKSKKLKVAKLAARKA